MDDQDDARALSVSLTLQELGQCVDVAITVNDMSFQMPGLVWRAEWEKALESLTATYTDSCAVLDKVLNTFSARLSYLGSFLPRAPSETSTEGSGYTRLTPEDLDDLKDLLVLTERSSVQALASSEVSSQQEACRRMQRSTRQLQLCRTLLQHLRTTLQSWLRQGRGDHGANAALSNPGIVQYIFEALESSTSWDQPPRWLRLAGVSRLWRDASRSSGACVFLPHDAEAQAVDGALQRLPTTRRLKCNLAHLNIRGAGGLTALLDLLEEATVLETLQIDRWVQCDKPPGAERIVTLPRLKYFEVIGVCPTNRRSGQTSLVRYIRLPAVERIAICDDAENTAAINQGPAALASQLSAIAGVLTSTSPCLCDIRQLSLDSLQDGLAVRARRSKSLEFVGSPSNIPITVRIRRLPPSQPIAIHIFIRFCQLLASLTTGQQPLQLHTLAIAAPPHDSFHDDDIYNSKPLELPLHHFASLTPLPEPEIVLFHLRDSRVSSSVRALNVQLLPVALSSGLPIGPAIEIVGLDDRISEELMRHNILQLGAFHQLLRDRATQGFRIHSIAFAAMPRHTTVPNQLVAAAQTWGDGVSLHIRQSALGEYHGKALVFQPLQ